MGKDSTLVLTIYMSYLLVVSGHQLFVGAQREQATLNKERIIQEALQAPAHWSELAAVNHNDLDLYAEILNDKIERQGLNVYGRLSEM
jgi:hypothetical protein